MTTIETADTVLHAPTGEEWLVAYVDGNSLCPCGWPETIAKASDCSLIKKATEQERLALIEGLAKMPGSGYDSRRSWARNYLMEAIS